MDETLVLAALPIILLAIAFVAYCLLDLRRSAVLHLPKWLWALVVIISVPLGGIVYLLVGREPGGRP